MSSERIVITVVGGAEDGKVFEFLGTPITLGCESDNDVCLTPNDGVASHHARILQEGDHYFVQDIEGHRDNVDSGTYVGGTKVQGEASIAPGESLLLGGTCVRFDAKPLGGGLQEVSTEKETRARMYEEYLQQEGYRPEVDGDGDIVFKAEGKVYVIIVDESDDEFFLLCLPSFWIIKNQEERNRVQSAALRATADTKVAKIMIADNCVWATIEMFCLPPESFKLVFERSMRALQASVSQFVELMRS